MSYEAITLLLAEHWSSCCRRNECPTSQGSKSRCSNLTSPPTGRFQMETGFTPALEHGPGQPSLRAGIRKTRTLHQFLCWSTLPGQESSPTASQSPYTAQVQVWRGSRRVMLGAVWGVRLVVHREQELAVGVFGNEAADGPLRVLAGQLLATFALGLSGAAPPPQVLRGQPRACPVGMCRALK